MSWSKKALPDQIKFIFGLYGVLQWLPPGALGATEDEGLCSTAPLSEGTLRNVAPGYSSAVETTAVVWEVPLLTHGEEGRPPPPPHLPMHFGLSADGKWQCWKYVCLFLTSSPLSL